MLGNSPNPTAPSGVMRVGVGKVEVSVDIVAVEDADDSAGYEQAVAVLPEESTCMRGVSKRLTEWKESGSAISKWRDRWKIVKAS